MTRDPTRNQQFQGFLLLDKPEGVTSRRCVDIVRRVSGGVKAGHSGTLDPFATGLLPVCLGRATRLVDFLRKGDKTYEAILRLGYLTDTLDRTGRIVQEQLLPPEVDLDTIRSAAAAMVGEFDQVPPMFSARKIDGIRLYKLARQSIEVERKPRRIRVYAFDVVSYEPPDVRFSVTCSEGTYVRSLGADLARSLGTVGTLEALRRTRIGRFMIEDAVSMARLTDVSGPEFIQWMHPSIDITGHLPALNVKPGRLKRFLTGCQLTEDDLVEPISHLKSDGLYNLFGEGQIHLGVTELLGRGDDGKSILKTIRLTDIDR